MNTTSTSLADLRAPVAPESRLPVVRAGFGDLQGFELMQRAAKAIAASTLVPANFQGNLPNCLIALEMAQRIGASPLMVCQNLYIVHGRPGWSAKFLIASFNQCGRFSAVRYEWGGTRGNDDWSCVAWATEKATGERIEGPKITIALAKAEDWYSKKGSKWQTIPELMLMYRAAAWMINTHAPEISMGLNTAEEIGDMFDAVPVGNDSWSVGAVSDLSQPSSSAAIIDLEVMPDEASPDAATIHPEDGPAPTVEGFCADIARAETEDAIATLSRDAKALFTASEMGAIVKAAAARSAHLRGDNS